MVCASPCPSVLVSVGLWTWRGVWTGLKGALPNYTGRTANWKERAISRPLLVLRRVEPGLVSLSPAAAPGKQEQAGAKEQGCGGLGDEGEETFSAGGEAGDLGGQAQVVGGAELEGQDCLVEE